MVVFYEEPFAGALGNLKNVFYMCDFSKHMNFKIASKLTKIRHVHARVVLWKLQYFLFVTVIQ